MQNNLGDGGMMKSNASYFFHKGMDISLKQKWYSYNFILLFYTVTPQHNHLCSSHISANSQVPKLSPPWQNFASCWHTHIFAVILTSLSDKKWYPLRLSDIPSVLGKDTSQPSLGCIWGVVKGNEIKAVNLCSCLYTYVRPCHLMFEENLLYTLGWINFLMSQRDHTNRHEIQICY
jgi:hypothetical protein